MNGKEGIEDAVLRCCDCYGQFTFSAGERRYFLSKGLTIPKRCPECRTRRKRSLVPDNEVRQ